VHSKFPESMKSKDDWSFSPFFFCDIACCMISPIASVDLLLDAHHIHAIPPPCNHLSLQFCACVHLNVTSRAVSVAAAASAVICMNSNPPPCHLSSFLACILHVLWAHARFHPQPCFHCCPLPSSNPIRLHP
jgi:hypothetical protein